MIVCKCVYFNRYRFIDRILTVFFQKTKLRLFV